MNINSDITLSQTFKHFDVWKFPIIHVNTSTFHNTRLGHWRLLHRCYLDVLGLSFSTHSQILFSSEYFHYKMFTSRGPVPGRSPVVGKHWFKTCTAHAKWMQGYLFQRISQCSCKWSWSTHSICYRCCILLGIYYFFYIVLFYFAQ
jgi:hypothetical protein